MASSFDLRWENLVETVNNHHPKHPSKFPVTTSNNDIFFRLLLVVGPTVDGSGSKLSQELRSAAQFPSALEGTDRDRMHTSISSGQVSPDMMPDCLRAAYLRVVPGYFTIIGPEVFPFNDLALCKMI